MEVNDEQMIAEDDELIVPMSIEYREDITADDFKELCRLCGNISNQLMPIFTGEGLEHNLPDKMREYLPVTVSLDDNLPLNICYQCASTLISWHELYYGAKEVDKRLRKISSGTVENKEDDDNFENNFKDGYDCGVSEVHPIFSPGDIASERNETDISNKSDILGEVLLPTETNDRCTSLNSNVLSVSSTEFRITVSQVSHTPDCYINIEDECEMTSRGSLSECNPPSMNDIPTLTPSSLGNDISVADPGQTSRCDDTDLAKNENKDLAHNAEIKSQLKTKTCDTCGRQFLNSVNLIVHLNELNIIQANRRLFQTPKPSKKVVVEVLEGEETFECGDCHEIFGQKNALRVHIVNEHLQVKKLECDICHWKYETVCDLATHRSVHTLNEKLICRLCGGRRRFSARRRYEATTNLVTCKCSLSNDSALPKSQPNLPLIETKLKPSARLSVTKPILAKIDTGNLYRKSNEWWNQTENSLPSVRRVQNVHITKCELCNLECGSYYALKKHKRTHNERVRCVICNKKYLKHYLKTHMLIHGSEKTFACDKCGKSFAQKSSLRAHQLLEENEKKFMCNICGEQFVLSSRMQWHMRSHMEVKPYKCVDCNKEYGYLWQLNQHRVAHSNERKFVCECCTKAYKTMKHLRQHWHHYPNHRK